MVYGELGEYPVILSHDIIQKSSPSGLRPRTLPLGNGGSQQYSIFTSELGRNTSVSLKVECYDDVQCVKHACNTCV